MYDFSMDNKLCYNTNQYMYLAVRLLLKLNRSHACRVLLTDTFGVNGNCVFLAGQIHCGLHH